MLKLGIILAAYEHHKLVDRCSLKLLVCGMALLRLGLRLDALTLFTFAVLS
jgi:hypothetical protein